MLEDIGASLSGIGPLIINVLITLMIAVVFVVVIWYFLNYSKYDTNVVILSTRHNNALKIFFDKGAFLKDKDGAEKFRLLKAKISMPPPNFEYLMPAKKGNVLVLYQMSDSVYTPLSINIDEFDKNGLKLKAGDADVRLWTTATLRTIRDTYDAPNWIEKYLPIAVFAMVAVLCIVLLYVTWEGFREAVSAMAPAMSNMANACKGGGSGGPF